MNVSLWLRVWVLFQLLSVFSLSAATRALTLGTNGNGAIAANPTGGTYPQNSVVTLTAAPTSGWQFTGWSGDISGTLNPTNVLMDTDKVITGNFTQIPSYTLAVNVSGSGSVNPVGGVYLSNTIVSLTATASNGWAFHHWTGDASGNANPISVTMNTNKTVSAIFVQPVNITAQPQNISAPPGGTATFNVTATGSAPISYVWRFNGSPISGATSATLGITNIQPANGGSYDVIVSNPYSATTSSVALLTVSCPGTNVVTVASDAALRAAVAIGGHVRLCFNGTVTLTNTLNIIKDVTLDANNVSIVIDGNNSVRLFNVSAGVNFTVTNLSLVNGLIVGTNTGGAAIVSAGTVRLISCVLSNNVARVPSGSASGSSASGGAIWNEGGIAEITGCSFMRNSLTGLGIGTNGPAHFLRGGAIYSAGTLTMVDSSLSENGVTAGLYPGHAFGGAVFAAGAVNITNATCYSNSCTALSDPSFTSSTALVKGGALFLHSGQHRIDGSLMVGNRLIGGYSRLSVPGVAEGGAVFSGGELFVRNSSIVSNTAAAGGGLAAANARGGGICSTGISVLSGATIAYNSAQGGAGRNITPASGTAGADALGGGLFSSGSLLVTNCTFVRNNVRGGDPGGFGSAAGSAYGGGIFKMDGVATLVNLTLATNQVNPGFHYGGGGGFALGSNIGNTNGMVTLKNTILAYPDARRTGSAGTNYPTTPTNVWGQIADGGYNMSSDGSANFGGGTSFNFTDPKLLPLANYGGPTLTMALAPDSPAIDWAPVAGAPPTDQRGFPRPFGTGVDPGAFELGPPMPSLAARRNGSSINLSFPGQAGMSYRIQHSSDFSRWETIETTGVLNANGTVSRNYPIAASPEFYRLELGL